jgi:hypothetical protein
MIARLFAVLVVGAAVVGCASAPSVDRVRTEAQAIAIAKQTCKSKSNEKWSATHIGRYWDAGSIEDGILIQGVMINAWDGKPGRCEPALDDLQISPG